MTTKKKIWIVLGGLGIFFVLIILLFLLTARDISNEKLGPSPFNVDVSIVSDDNLEYQTITDLGKMVQGYEELTKNYDLDLYDPQPTIFQLLAYLEKNEGVIEKIDLELFKNIKFPPSKVEVDPNFKDIHSLLRLIQNRILFNILTNNIENAKTDLILSNHISDELIKKTSNIFIGMVLLSNKGVQIDNLNLLINQSDCTFEEKLEFLSLKLEPIPVQFLKNILHFDIEFYQKIIRNLNNPTEKRNQLFQELPYIPIINPLLYQPNKSAKYFRKLSLELIDRLEKPSFNSYSFFTETKLTDHSYMKYLKSNCLGRIGVEEMVSVMKYVSKKILSINNQRNQLFIAQQILLYKTKNGALPKNLSDLGVAKELYTDIQTGDPFLYYEPNGILQSLGRNKENCNIDLTTKPLTPEEIHDILCDSYQKRDFILYLK